MPASGELRGLRRPRCRDPRSHSLLCRRESGDHDGGGRRRLAALVECVPNFSEGRRLDIITAIADAIREAGARVIDVQADAAHNRMVVTFVAEPALAVDAAMAGATVATERIDLRPPLEGAPCSCLLLRRSRPPGRAPRAGEGAARRLRGPGQPYSRP